MGLEVFTGKIADLVPTWPTGTDPKSQGDDHLRGIKLTIQQDCVAKGEFELNPGIGGYQKLPSGLIIQWGEATTDAGGSVSVPFPMPFPTDVLQTVASTTVANTTVTVAWQTTTALDLLCHNPAAGTGAVALIRWIAIGH